MTAKEFWERVDSQLRRQDISITEMCSLIEKSPNTVFSQRKKLNMPKADQIRRMEEVLRCSLLDDSSDDPFVEYLPYLRQAEEWQLRSVRQILGMPDVEKKKMEALFQR